MCAVFYERHEMSVRLIPNEIVKSTNGRLASGSALTMLTGVCTSVSKVSPGCLFVPLIINGADGHRDIDTALKKGAGGALCQSSSGKISGLAKKWPMKILVEVEDSREALLSIACFWRHKIGATAIIGTPGSEPVLSLATNMLKAKKDPFILSASKDELHTTALRLLELNATHGWVLIEVENECSKTAEHLCEMCMSSIAVVVEDTPCARALLDTLETPAVVLIPDTKTFPSGFKPRKGVRLAPCNSSDIPSALRGDAASKLTHMCMAVALAKHCGLGPDEIQTGLDALK
jgi:UDP-N-acetylmuramyl pentapeptide synthase